MWKTRSTRFIVHQVDMQLVCFAVNYVGSAMAKTRLKTSSASEIGVTGAEEAIALVYFGNSENKQRLNE